MWCGTRGLLSTPATSAVIRCRGAGREPFGGFLCTASHNPGGLDHDFGVKYHCENGGPAPEKITNVAFRWTTEITEYKICNVVPDLDLSVPRIYDLGGRVVEVFDSVEDHLALLQTCFDFASISALVTREGFSMTYDSMCGVQGPYAVKILEEVLGAAPGTCKNAVPRPDFGGEECPWRGHADPNLMYAVELIRDMGLDSEGNRTEAAEPIPLFGAATDGDADRNMILSPHFFVCPSDSVAMIVANAHLIPQFKDGLKGCARSMATSRALDLVAQRKGIECFEVPTGWKFFGNLMDSGTLLPGTTYTPFICGEESFGTGADHLREKDGMWACLAWLQILARKSEAAGRIVTVEDVAHEHWREYGRNYYARYDFEDVDKARALDMMAHMDVSVRNLVGQTFGAGFVLKTQDVFHFTDPVDGSVSKNNGTRFIFEDGSRIVFRLSGTGVQGATVRFYVEKYEPPSGNLREHPFEAVKPLAAVALEVSRLVQYTGRDTPNVIT